MMLRMPYYFSLFCRLRGNNFDDETKAALKAAWGDRDLDSLILDVDMEW